MTPLSSENASPSWGAWCRPEILRGSVGGPGVKRFDDISHVPFVVSPHMRHDPGTAVFMTVAGIALPASLVRLAGMPIRQLLYAV